MSSQNESHVVEGKDVVVRQKSADAGVDNIFKYFTADGGEWDWSVVFGKFPSILFVQYEDVSDTPVCTPEFSDWLNIKVSIICGATAFLKFSLNYSQSV